MSDEIAYHEAGHVLMAYLLGGEVQSVTIEPDRDDGPRRDGDTQVLWRGAGGAPRETAEKEVQVCLAGPAAEMLYTGEPYHPRLVAEWAADWRGSWDAAALLHPDERLRTAYLERTSIRIYRRFREEPLWSALAALADHLLAHETLAAEEIEEIVAPWLGGDL